MGQRGETTPLDLSARSRDAFEHQPPVLPWAQAAWRLGPSWLVSQSILADLEPWRLADGRLKEQMATPARVSLNGLARLDGNYKPRRPLRPGAAVFVTLIYG